MEKRLRNILKQLRIEISVERRFTLEGFFKLLTNDQSSNDVFQEWTNESFQPCEKIARFMTFLLLLKSEIFSKEKSSRKSFLGWVFQHSCWWYYESYFLKNLKEKLPPTVFIKALENVRKKK